MDNRTLLNSDALMAGRMISFAVLILLAGLLVACGGGGGTEPTATVAAPDRAQAPEQPAAGGNSADTGGAPPPSGGGQVQDPQRPADPGQGEAPSRPPAPAPQPAPETPTGPENGSAGGWVTAPTPTSSGYPILCNRAHGDGAVVKGGQLRWDRAAAEVDGRTFDLSAVAETGGQPSNAGYNNPEVVSVVGRSVDNKALAIGRGRDGRPRSVSIYDFAAGQQWDCSVGIVASPGEETAVCYFAMGSFSRGFGPPTYAGFWPGTGELIRWDMAEGRIETTARALPFEATGNMAAQCEGER